METIIFAVLVYEGRMKSYICAKYSSLGKCSLRKTQKFLHVSFVEVDFQIMLFNELLLPRLFSNKKYMYTFIHKSLFGFNHHLIIT